MIIGKSGIRLVVFGWKSELLTLFGRALLQSCDVLFLFLNNILLLTLTDYTYVKPLNSVHSLGLFVVSSK